MNEAAVLVRPGEQGVQVVALHPVIKDENRKPARPPRLARWVVNLFDRVECIGSKQ